MSCGNKRCSRTDAELETLIEDMECLENQLMHTKQVIGKSHLSKREIKERATQLVLMKSAFDSIDCKFNDISKRLGAGSGVIAEGKDDEKRERKIINYTAKVKCCSKLYMTLNGKLTIKLTAFSKTVHHLPTQDEIDELEAKVKRYDIEILNLEKKYPWLRNPGCGTALVLESKRLEILREEHYIIISKLDLFKSVMEPLIRYDKKHELALLKNQNILY